MDLLLSLLGIALVILTMLDALWTTLWVDGSAGPISARATTWTWRSFLRLLGRDRHRALSVAGPFTLFATVVIWAVLLLAGWVLVFAGGDHALLSTSDQTPADWTGRVYFVAYMMFTAGNGDFAPDGDGWQIAAALSNATGMIIITLAITYLLSVISAVVRKRAFASQVAGLGQSAVDILRTGWNGRDFRSLDLPLNSLSSQISTLSQQYEAYPVLQYYHAASADKSPVVQMIALDEALTMLCHGVPEEVRPSPAVLSSVRASVTSFLATMPSAFIRPAPDAPPPPDLQALRRHGIPAAEDAAFRAAVDALSDRRRNLLGLLRNDGWNWADR